MRKSKLEIIFPKFRGENSKKYLSCHQPSKYVTGVVSPIYLELWAPTYNWQRPTLYLTEKPPLKIKKNNMFKENMLTCLEKASLVKYSIS